VTLLNGTVTSKRDLFLKTIELDPSLGPPYNDLAGCSGPSITLHDGTTMTGLDLFLKAAHLNP
jgi:hypothetical protein